MELLTRRPVGAPHVQQRNAGYATRRASSEDAKRVTTLQLALQRKSEENDELRRELREANEKVDALVLKLESASFLRRLSLCRRRLLERNLKRDGALVSGSGDAEPLSLEGFLRQAEAERREQKERDEQKLIRIRAESAREAKLTEKDLEAAAAPLPSTQAGVALSGRSRPQLKSLKSHKWHDTGSGMGGSTKNLRDAPVSTRRKARSPDALARLDSRKSESAKDRLQAYREQRRSAPEVTVRLELTRPAASTRVRQPHPREFDSRRCSELRLSHARGLSPIRRRRRRRSTRSLARRTSS